MGARNGNYEKVKSKRLLSKSKVNGRNKRGKKSKQELESKRGEVNMDFVLSRHHLLGNVRLSAKRMHHTMGLAGTLGALSYR